MHCRFCNHFLFDGDQAVVINMSQDQPWLFSIICLDCMQDLQSDNPDRYRHYTTCTIGTEPNDFNCIEFNEGCYFTRRDLRESCPTHELAVTRG